MRHRECIVLVRMCPSNGRCGGSGIVGDGHDVSATRPLTLSQSNAGLLRKAAGRFSSEHGCASPDATSISNASTRCATVTASACARARAFRVRRFPPFGGGGSGSGAEPSRIAVRHHRPPLATTRPKRAVTTCTTGRGSTVGSNLRRYCTGYCTVQYIQYFKRPK